MIIIILKSNCSGLPTRAINASVTVTSSLTDALIPSRCEKGVQCARPWHWTPVICDAVLAAVCEPPLCVSLLSSWYAPPHQTSEYVRVCACVRVVRKQAAEAGLEMDLVAAASPPILFSVFFFLHPPFLSPPPRHSVVIFIRRPHPSLGCNHTLPTRAGEDVGPAPPPSPSKARVNWGGWMGVSTLLCGILNHHCGAQ